MSSELISMTKGHSPDLTTDYQETALDTDMDRAGRSYWDQVWQGQPLPAAIDPRDTGLRNHVERRFHEFFASAFAERQTAGQALLEVGGGRSRWLPYFAKEFGFNVTGIDYSPIGCEQGEAILRNAGVGGSVILANFFTPPQEMLGAYDVVVSFGVIEHFEDTESCVASLARFLKPGGLMITSIPNLVGGVGWIQRRVCRSIYDMHVPLDREALRTAHERAGLSVRSCDYLVSGDLSVMNLSCWSGSRFYGTMLRLSFMASLAAWFLDEKNLMIRPNRWTSRYVICSARK